MNIDISNSGNTKHIRLKSFFSLLCVIIVIASCLIQISNTKRYKQPDKIISSDVVSYYDYLPATFIQHDYNMNFIGSGKQFTGTYWPFVLPNGNKVLKTSMGLSIMYSPFFFIANANAHSPHSKYAADGFTQPYAHALMLSCVFYLLLGLFFLRSYLLNFFGDLVTGLTILVTCLSTNMFWYATVESPMSHVYDFALFCIFIWLTDRWYKKKKYLTSIFLGIIFGLITLIRPSNALIIIFLLLYDIQNWNDIKIRWKCYISNYWHVIIFLLLAFLVWVPQMLYWKSLSGSFIFYSYYDAASGAKERFFFNDPKIWQVLFSFRRGWLIYTPIMIFAVCGLFMLRKEYKRFAIPIIVFSIVNVYVISCWWCWWYGGGFGMRPLIDSYGIMAIPMAVCLTRILQQKRLVRIPIFVLFFVIALFSGFQTVKYYYGSIHWGEMTKEAYFDSYWRIYPKNTFYDKLRRPDYDAARRGIRNQ